jgi:hypothetical protein
VDSGRTPLVSIPTSGSSTGENATSTPANSVEAAVREEIATLSGMRPGLVAVAVAMARILDNPKAVSSQPPAAKVLRVTLDKLPASAPGRRGNLRVGRAMTDRGEQGAHR